MKAFPADITLKCNIANASNYLNESILEVL